MVDIDYPMEAATRSYHNSSNAANQGGRAHWLCARMKICALKEAGFDFHHRQQSIFTNYNHSDKLAGN